MKMVGFLAKHEKKILSTAIEYSNTDMTQNGISVEFVNGLLKYLAAGKYIFGMPLAIEDENGKYISSYIVYGDGEWLWPAYLSYYLKSGSPVDLPAEFLKHVKENNFEFPEVTAMQEQKAKYFFMTLLTIPNRDSFRQ
jgi:hypothetical protein